MLIESTLRRSNSKTLCGGRVQPLVTFYKRLQTWNENETRKPDTNSLAWCQETLVKKKINSVNASGWKRMIVRQPKCQTIPQSQKIHLTSLGQLVIEMLQLKINLSEKAVSNWSDISYQSHLTRTWEKIGTHLMTTCVHHAGVTP